MTDRYWSCVSLGWEPCGECPDCLAPVGDDPFARRPADDGDQADNDPIVAKGPGC